MSFLEIMKRFLLGILSTIGLISVSFTTVNAQTVNKAIDTLPPQKLIKLARQGRFKAQGIPSYSRLNSSIRSGKVNAQTLVASAVAQNRLPQTALQDVAYLNAIENHLKSGGCGSL